ncbi:MAG: archease [Deferrisomatales bacterium]
MGEWFVLEHTADLALEARGDSPEEALEALCLGLAAQVVDPRTVAPRETVEIVYEGMDRPETLVGALGELLYWIQTRGWAFHAFRVREAGERRIALAAWGEPRDPARHRVGTEIKAATYHGLRFERDPDRQQWVLRVLFDV